MEIKKKATRINLLDFKTVPMRTFHMAWFAFFLCFFGWFGIAPLMPIIRDELALTKTQIGNTIIASVAITILVRLFVGWLCDKIGPRRAYTGLLILGSLPVMAIGFSQNYETFLFFRLAIGAIGASFVITQYHTSVMFAPNCVGAANATAAGWGNLGGGVTQMVMPLILAGFLSLGVGEFWGWRLAMVVPGLAMLLTGVAYCQLTKDYPEGNIEELRARGSLPGKAMVKGSFRMVVQDPRVWLLAIIYGLCFGVELTIHNIAALYYTDKFQLSMTHAGMVAGLYGLMNIFTRTLGGIFSDRWAVRRGLKGRVSFLGLILFCAGVALVVFARMNHLALAIGAMILFSLFVQMSSGATYSVVPFINRKAIGAVAGIVGAGGNTGAVLFGFLMRSESLSYSTALIILGVLISAGSFLVLFVRFSVEDEREVRLALETAKAEQRCPSGRQ
jgi:NNP family nitrate/nitrite transporter-like MFS transporter